MTFRKTFEAAKADFKPLARRGMSRNTVRGCTTRRTDPTRMTFTHDQLVTVAREWLRRHHPVVLTELTVTGGECADALGFGTEGGTTLVECKASRSDFHADKKKVFRRCPERGMGHQRYFLAPAGLLKVDELPAGWGLLEWNGRFVKHQLVGHAFASRNQNAETGALVSALRRLGQRVDAGVSIRVFSFTRYKKMTGRESVNKATLSVEVSE